MLLRIILLSVIIIGISSKSTELINYQWKGRGSAGAVRKLLNRTLKMALPDVDAVFQLDIVSSCTVSSNTKSNLCFELIDNDGVRGTGDDTSVSSSLISAKATSAVDLAAGVAYYLRHYCNMSFSWNRTGGNQVRLPLKWPNIGNRIVRYRKTDISYFSNVVTFSYTLPWMAFTDWEKLIDWMALSGINLVVAYTGQEEVYRKVFNSFGVNDTIFSNWTNGPAHLAWSRGQSMHGVAGPLPKSWMTAQWDLQRKILTRERALGIVPILPAFQGNVPPLISDIFPTANISVQGHGRHWSAWLDATDPLFQKIADKYMQQLIADFGIDIDEDGIGDSTDHWYEADGYFTSGRPPWKNDKNEPFTSDLELDLIPIDEEAYIHAGYAYRGMNATDPDAIWMYQGWIVDKQSVMNAYLQATPTGKFIITDMWAEWSPIWPSLTKVGVPFLYGTLHNFGGNVGMWGNIVQLINGTKRAPSIFEGLDSICANGIGAFMEGFDQNSFYYAFLFDTNWVDAEKIDFSDWIEQYAQQRYGFASKSAVAAWHILGDTVYGIERPEPVGGNTGMYREKARDALTASPLLGNEARPQPEWYDLKRVFSAWELLLTAADELGEISTTLSYDMVNVGREALATLSNRVFEKLNASSTVSDLSHNGKLLLDMHKDADRLLCADDGFTLSHWLESAAQWGVSQKEKQFYEWTARVQPTTWLPACEIRPETREDGICGTTSGLMDYANKQWGGLVGTFYSGKLQVYLEQATKDMTAGLPVNMTAYRNKLDDFAWEWQHDFGGHQYPLCISTGSVQEVSTDLIAKYKPIVL